MNEQAEKYLKLARNAREGNDAEDAKKYYDMVRTEDPENTEAAFYYLYYRLWDSIKRDWGNNYITLCQRTESIIKKIAGSDATDGEKLNLLKDIFKDSKDLWQTARKIQMEISNNSGNFVVTGFEYDRMFGDTVEKCFGPSPDFTALAVEAWKAALDVYSNYRFVALRGSFKEEIINEYAAKIKKYEPSFELQKGSGTKGCIVPSKQG